MTAHQRHVTKEKKRETTIRKPHLRGRGPHFPLLDTIVQYEFEPTCTRSRFGDGMVKAT